MVIPTPIFFNAAAKYGREAANRGSSSSRVSAGTAPRAAEPIPPRASAACSQGGTAGKPDEGGTGTSSYWLGAEGKLNQSVTIDLGAPTMITEIHLRNTHNAQYNDRNTMDFKIDAANDVSTCGAGKRSITTLVNPITILMGTLSDVDGITCPDEIVPDIFDSHSGLNTGGVAFRYLQFTAINSYHDPNVDGKNTNVGLNEFEVYGSQ